MNTKLNCLLLDDELPGLMYLKMLCEQIPGLEVVRAFNDPHKFLEALPGLNYNLCILDIEMPGLNGLEVAQHLQGTAVIFTTAYKEHAADAFDLNAVDYIRKPIQKERLEAALQKAAERIAATPPAPQYLQLNTDKGKALIPLHELIYITSSDTDKRDKLAYLEGQKKYTLKNITFEHLLAQLPEQQFCRINKKDIIALKAVTVYTHERVEIQLYNKGLPQLILPLSEVYREAFRNKLE